jgi:hypothetical protein
MRFFITLLLTLAVGIGIAFGLAKLIGIWFPKQAPIVFWLIAAWWLWTAWKYSKALNEGRL